MSRKISTGEAGVTTQGSETAKRLAAGTFSGWEKGLPGAGERAISLSDISAAGWSLLRGDLPLPVCTLNRLALEHNSRRMLQFLDAFGSGIVLCPHGKTTMSPQIFQRQLDDGCWGITLATFHQVRAARRLGFQRIFYANELVGKCEIDFILNELADNSDFDFYCLVDCVEGAERLGKAAARRASGRRLQVLVEGGFIGGRCGARSLETALATARAVHAHSPHLRLVGLEGYEGLMQARPAAEREAGVPRFIDALIEMIRGIDAEGLFDDCTPILFSAGGSSFYDLIAEVPQRLNLSKPLQVIIRSGCYLTHDSGLYRRLLEDLRLRSDIARASDLSFQPALEVWCYVVSIPEPNRIVLGAGQRDYGHDAAPPLLIKAIRQGGGVAPEKVELLSSDDFEIAIINDQHTTVRAPQDHGLKIGDKVALSPSHPCTTFDKWRLIYEVDDAYTVMGAVETFF